MLGNVHDAQDATQDILIRIMTRLDSFHQESAFTTWVYTLSVNYLINYKKSIFAQHSLSRLRTGSSKDTETSFLRIAAKQFCDEYEESP